jgi:ABC-type transporter Mla MlaB component
VTSGSSRFLAIQSAGLPLPQEAALMYADGRAAEAEKALTRALDAGGPHAAQAWEMLFDLHRTQGDWRAFEALAERFAQETGRAAPAWLDEQALAWLPEPLQQGGQAYLRLVGSLDARQAHVVDDIRRAADDHAAVHLDLTRVQGATGEGCTALLATLRFLIEHGNGVHLTGAERVAALLRETAAAGAASCECWPLVLELYRLRGRQGHFQRAALEYALATGATPPEWQPALMPVIAAQSPQEKRDQPRYQAGPDQIQLDGTLTGASHPLLAELRQFAADRQYVNIVMDQLDRIDLACATAFVELANRLAQAGKTVRLIRPNSLVHALLATFSLDPQVVLVKPRPV